MYLIMAELGRVLVVGWSGNVGGRSGRCSEEKGEVGEKGRGEEEEERGKGESGGRGTKGVGIYKYYEKCSGRSESQEKVRKNSNDGRTGECRRREHRAEGLVEYCRRRRTD